MDEDALREPHPGYTLSKRVIDVVGSLLLLAVLSPLLVGVAVIIRLTSRGPIIFRQERVGLDRRSFRAYKFRSMYRDAERRAAELRELAEGGSLSAVDAPAFKSAEDPRVTPIGRFIRKFSIDELPQLFNVLGGSMSFVGPRPLVQLEADQLTPEADVRHRVKPGITCIWQVSGRSEIAFDQRMAMDLEYVRRRSLWLDLLLLLKTPWVVFTARGAM